MIVGERKILTDVLSFIASNFWDDIYNNVMILQSLHNRKGYKNIKFLKIAYLSNNSHILPNLYNSRACKNYRMSEHCLVLSDK